jgi:uncharacterized damage-inducible protein DinB
MDPVPAFLRGNVEGYGTLSSAWVRGLESAEELVRKWTEGLPSEAYSWSPAPETNSIGGLLNHVATSILRLGLAIRGEEHPPELRKSTSEQLAAAPEDPAVLLERFRSACARARTWLKDAGEADLERICELQGRGRAPAAHLWHKMVEHAHEHVGQIITLRKLWNATPRPQPPAAPAVGR